MTRNKRTYKVVRYYAPFGPYAGHGPRTVRTGLTLTEAQKHCRDPKTRSEGEWFDGFTLER